MMSSKLRFSQLLRFTLLSTTLASGLTLVSGCSGGNSSGSSVPTGVARFAGTYEGRFAGVVSPGIPGAGSPVSGTFTATINNNGKITGTLNQPGIGEFPITGTIDSAGTINATAALVSGQVATLAGTLTVDSGTYNITGTFKTTNGDVTVVTGTIST